MNIVEKLPRKKCVGCGSCKVSCPLNIIDLIEDPMGFLYPKIIDGKHCIDCGMCVRCCPRSEGVIVNESDSTTFLGFSNDETIVDTSTSGGIIRQICSIFLNSGIVYCVSESIDNHHSFNRLSSKDDINRISKTVYFQISPVDVFSNIEDDLNNQRRVLFVGTPCQVSSMKAKYGKNNLFFAIDFICHGVPSRKLFEEYKTFLEKQHGRIENYDFRYKNGRPWNNYAIRVNDTIIEKRDDVFSRLFLGDCFLRESCYSCEEKPNKNSDITVGDAWGSYPNCEAINKKGTSMIFVNSPKGEELLNSIQESITIVPHPKSLLLNNNLAYASAAKKPNKRKKLESKKFESFEEMCNWVFTPTLLERMHLFFVSSKAKLRKIFRKRNT